LKVLNAVLEKDGENQLDRASEKKKKKREKKKDILPT
jgi:hypothetical protein